MHSWYAMRSHGQRFLTPTHYARQGVDMPLLVHHVYVERSLYMRGLADHMHFDVPAWGWVLEWVGAVVGSRDTCATLMQARYGRARKLVTGSWKATSWRSDVIG